MCVINVGPASRYMPDMVGIWFIHILGKFYKFGKNSSISKYVLTCYGMKKNLNMHKTFSAEQRISHVRADILQYAWGRYIEHYLRQG